MLFIIVMIIMAALLLDDEEMQDLAALMQEITAYGNVAFKTIVPTRSQTMFTAMHPTAITTTARHRYMIRF